MQQLPEIIFERDAKTAVDLIDKYPDMFKKAVDSSFDFFSGLTRAFPITDACSKRFLERTNSPYQDEIADIAAKVGKPGGYTIALPNEWACSTTSKIEDDGTVTQFRMLDWGLPDMGTQMMCHEQSGAAGSFYNLTLAGNVGVIQGMAPGRFAISINRAPFPRRFEFLHQSNSEFLNDLGLSRDIWANRLSNVFAKEGTPPILLMRQVYEEAVNYNEAKEILTNTKLTTPAIFTITGTTQNENHVIERMIDRAAIHKGPLCATNTWITKDFGASHSRPHRFAKGYIESENGENRLEALENNRTSIEGNFDWLQRPTLNNMSVLACEFNAKRGTVRAVGLKDYDRATQVLEIGCN